MTKKGEQLNAKERKKIFSLKSSFYSLVLCVALVLNLSTGIASEILTSPVVFASYGQVGGQFRDSDICENGVDDDDDGAVDESTCFGYDDDGDGIRDKLGGLTGAFTGGDNCNGIYNPDQKDTDGDLRGDACDPDFLDGDKDGVVDSKDNCPSASNADQRDSNRNKIGDACDSSPPGSPQIEIGPGTDIREPTTTNPPPSPGEPQTEIGPSGSKLTTPPSEAQTEGLGLGFDPKLTTTNPPPPRSEFALTEQGLCNDHIDNDQDGLMDTQDIVDCPPAVEPQTEIGPGTDIREPTTTNPPSAPGEPQTEIGPSGSKLITQPPSEEQSEEEQDQQAIPGEQPPESDPSAETTVPPTVPTERGFCEDGVDNDQDGLTDIQDTEDCPPALEEPPGTEPQPPEGEQPEGEQPEGEQPEGE